MKGTILAAAALAVAATTSTAQECYNPKYLTAFLKLEHGLSLQSWGLDDAGNMVELFLADGGHWAVMTTTPDQCATVAMPHQLRGRLVAPVAPNSVVKMPRSMTKGDPT